VVDHTPVKHEVFGSIPSTGIKKKKKSAGGVKTLGRVCSNEKSKLEDKEPSFPPYWNG
jgi:hypothetical protein